MSTKHKHKSRDSFDLCKIPPGPPRSPICKTDSGKLSKLYLYSCIVLVYLMLKNDKIAF